MPSFPPMATMPCTPPHPIAGNGSRGTFRLALPRMTPTSRALYDFDETYESPFLFKDQLNCFVSFTTFLFTTFVSSHRDFRSLHSAAVSVDVLSLTFLSTPISSYQRAGLPFIFSFFILTRTMFAPKQFLALAAILSGIDAACVHRSAGTSLIPQTSSVEVPAYSPSSAVTSSTVTSSSLPAAAPTNGGGELTSTLVASPSAFASNSVAQNIATSSAAAQASASSTSSAASATGSAASGSSSTTSTSSSSDGTKYMVVL